LGSESKERPVPPYPVLRVVVCYTRMGRPLAKKLPGECSSICPRRISPPLEARARAETRACSVVIRANALHPLGETRASQPSGFIGARRRHVSSGNTGGPLRVAGRHWSAKDTQNGQYFFTLLWVPSNRAWQREVPRQVRRELCPTGPISKQPGREHPGLIGFGLKGDPQRPSPMHRRTCDLSSQPSARVGHK
jgi:hypothetical protein